MRNTLRQLNENRSSFETFKSNVCHDVNDNGDLDFIYKTLKSNKIRNYFNKEWYPESLYLLAMVDYLSKENNIPLCTDYNDLRKAKLKDIIYPQSILALSAITNDNKYKEESIKESIPEFLRFNIVESEIRNVI